MNHAARFTLATALAAGFAFGALADQLDLLTGVDAGLYPGAGRTVLASPGPSNPATFYDGDRLAGTPSVGPAVPFVGSGTPMYDPNEFGSLSMLFRRGTIPPFFGPNYTPLMGIEFLGGPLLDLDGDLNNSVRSLIPVEDATPVEIPGTSSFIELDFDTTGGTVTLVDFDATGNNEGGPGVDASTATILVTIAGTGPEGQKTGSINPGIDTRSGTLTAFTGSSGTLAGVYAIEDLGYELWEDTISLSSGSADVLGTMQFLGTFQGWLIEKDPNTGAFPTLTGEGLGGTRWPDVDTSEVGNSFNTANGLAGGTATIANGVPADNYSVAGNGGVALTDFGGDLGAYLDSVVLPLVPAWAARVVYLESAGFGINNSGDPIFTDTIDWDAGIVAGGGCFGGDANCDGLVNNADIPAFVLALSSPQDWAAQYDCDFVCANDVDEDGSVNNADIPAFIARLTQTP